MTKKTRTIVFAVAIIAVFAVVAVGSLLIVLFERKNIQHLQSGGLDLVLTRENLISNSLDENGNLVSTTDGTQIDFTKSSDENIFGITSKTVIVPGSMFAVSMEISNNSANSQPFVYWLGIELGGELNELSKQLKVTVTVEDGEERSFYLGEGLLLGSEQNPLAIVEDKNSSRFGVKVEF